MSDLKVSTCWKDSDNIIWSTITNSSDSPFKMKDANDLIEEQLQLCDNKTSAFILDLRNLEQSVDREVVFYYATHTQLNTLRNCHAIINLSQAGWFFASYFTNYVNNIFPSRVFSEEKDALEWSQTLLSNT